MKILALESSCDETAAAVVENGRTVLSSVVATQIEQHKIFGGVVPEIASRMHTEAISAVTAEAFREAFQDTDLIVLDAGRFGFVKLQYYVDERGFDSVSTFCDGEDLFEDLWNDWLYIQLLRFAKDTPMAEMEYEDIFKCMPKEMQDSYVLKKQEFMKNADCNLIPIFNR